MSRNPESSPQDSLRNAQKQITRAFFLSLTALAVTVLACYAWFVNNSTVSGTNMSISASGRSFELASLGSTGEFDNEMPPEYQILGDDWPDPNPSGTSTGSSDAILWRVSPASNLNNHTDGSGIRPGTSGSLQFFVIPKRSGTLRLTFQLEQILLDASGNVISDETANRLMQSHLLFAFQKGSDSPELVPYHSGVFSLGILTVEDDTPILVTLHWIWPLYLINILEDDLAGAFQNHQICSAIVDWMDAAPGDFFFNGKDQSGIPIAISSPNFGAQTPGPRLIREYSNYYNEADQYIGQNVSGLVLQLTAVEG